MKSKIHSFLIYPLILLFAHFLKGKKESYTNFFTKENDKTLNKLNILSLEFKKFEFYDTIKIFFDKKKEYHDRTSPVLNIDLDNAPEKREDLLFTFLKKVDILYSLSMLSARISNFNILMSLKLTNQKEENLNHFMRYCLLAYASRKIDYLDIKVYSKMSKKYETVFNTMVEYLNNSEIENFSKSQDLYVLTCKKDKKKFDIVWSSSNRTIELEEFTKVYDKFGNEMKKDIVISQSPIYAFHK